MIVRDQEDHWQVVLQTDHADVCGQLAEAWASGGVFRPPDQAAALAVAARRHDDGWAIWDRMPMADGGSGKPLNFLDIDIPVHLAFWRAASQAVSLESPYSGLIVGLHGAGIYQGRYGLQPNLKMTFADDVQDLVDDFVREQERRFPSFVEDFKLDEDEVWRDYRLLQVFDLLSLYFSGQDMRGGLAVDEAGSLTPVPVDLGSGPVDLRVTPLGDRRYRLDPFPFAESSLRLRLIRRVVPKGNEGVTAQVRSLVALPGELLEIELVK